MDTTVVEVASSRAVDLHRIALVHGDVVIRQLQVPCNVPSQYAPYVARWLEERSCRTVVIESVVTIKNFPACVGADEVEMIDAASSEHDTLDATTAASPLVYPCSSPLALRVGEGFCGQCEGCGAAGKAVEQYLTPVVPPPAWRKRHWYVPAHARRLEVEWWSH